MASRFGLDPNALRVGQQRAQEQQEASQGLPTCTNCRTDNCNRCPTAITNHGRSDWSSDFDCAHYHADEDEHARLVEADDDAFYDGNSGGHFGRVDWDSEGRQAWDSVDGKFNG